MFSVVGGNGSLVVGQGLDYDRGQKQYRFPVLAIDKGRPALTG